MKTNFTLLIMFLTINLLHFSNSAQAQFTHFPTNGAPIFGKNPVAKGNLDNPDKHIWVKVNGNMAGPQPHNKMHPYVTPGSKVDINFNVNKAGNRYTLVSYSVDSLTGKRTIYDYQSNFYNASKPVQGNSNQQLVLVPTCKFEVYFVKGTLVTDFLGTPSGATPYNPVADLNNPYTNGPDGNLMLDFAYGGSGTCETCPTVINTTDCVYPRLLEVIDRPATQEKELIFSIINNINTNTNACGTGWPEIGDIIFTNIYPSHTGNNQPYQFRYNYQLGPQIPGYPLSGVTPPLPANYQGSFVFDQRNNHNVLDFDVYQSEIVRFRVSETEYNRLSSPGNTVIPQICVELSNKHPEPHQTLPPVYCADIDFVCEPACPTVVDEPCYKEDCCFGYTLIGSQIGAGAGEFRPAFEITNLCGANVTSVSFSTPGTTATSPGATERVYTITATPDLLTFSDPVPPFNSNVAPGNFDDFFYTLPQSAVLAPGGNMVTVTVITTVGTFSQTFDLLTSDPNCGITPLPVELLYFKGKASENGIELTWETASEKNNDHFEIQRSTNGLNFEMIGTVKGAGTTNTLTAYKFLDRQPAASLQYYRLKQTDTDGTSKHSPIIKVSSDRRSQPLTVQLVPNPCGTENCSIKIQGFTSGSTTLLLQDLAGRIVFSKELSDDRNAYEIPRSGLENGIYILTARNGKYTAYQKIIIQ